MYTQTKKDIIRFLLLFICGIAGFIVAFVYSYLRWNEISEGLDKDKLKALIIMAQMVALVIPTIHNVGYWGMRLFKIDDYAEEIRQAKDKGNLVFNIVALCLLLLSLVIDNFLYGGCGGKSSGASLPPPSPWTKQLGTAFGDYAYGVATDVAGNIYAAGGTGDGLDGNTSAGGYDLFVVKYDPTSVKQWTRQSGTASNDSAFGVATDPAGNIYVVGSTNAGLDGNTYAGLQDFFVVKYDPTGVKQWTR